MSDVQVVDPEPEKESELPAQHTEPNAPPDPKSPTVDRAPGDPPSKT